MKLDQRNQFSGSPLIFFHVVKESAVSGYTVTVKVKYSFVNLLLQSHKHINVTHTRTYRHMNIPHGLHYEIYFLQ